MAKDYSDIGLNDKLQQVDSLAAKPSSFMNSLLVDSNIEAIGAVKISDTFKVVKRGSITLTGNDLATDNIFGTVSHNLGYPPTFAAYMVSTDQYFPIPYMFMNNSTTANINGTIVVAGFAESVITAYSNTTDLVFNFEAQNMAIGVLGSGAGPWSYDIRYYIFREPAK